jgi:lysine-specific demethylase 8
MYPYPASNADQSINPAANTLNQSMSNTSRVDVFPSSTNAQEACRREYPDFWVHVVPDTIHTTLEPGDVLFFPPGWWHAMRSEEASFSVSMWF